MIDLHIHSNFSRDSKQSIDSYFQNSTASSVVTTEHLDFMQDDSKLDMIVDYQHLKQEVERCSQQFAKRGLVGIEIGYTIESKQRVLAFLSDKQFDFKIVSVHQDCESDYLYKPDGYVVDVDYYLETVISALTNVPGVDSLGHIDYPFRANQLDSSFLTNDKLDIVFTLLIDLGIALEVNTRSLYQYHNLDLMRKLLVKYYQQGGRLISLGSDAHSLDYYQYCFVQAIELLQTIGDFEVINERYQ